MWSHLQWPLYVQTIDRIYLEEFVNSFYWLNFADIFYTMPNRSFSHLKFRAIRTKIISFVFMTFLGYFCIGLPLAVLPLYIHKTLGFGEMMAGIVVSLQYVATFAVRAYAGTLVDKKGPKLAVSLSMTGFAASGLLMLLAFRLEHFPVWSLFVLMLTRLLTGFGEGMIGASPVNWAMIIVGNQHTAQAISYNGVASYGALALGAPLGVVMTQYMGHGSIAVLTMLVGIGGFVYTLPKRAVKVTSSVQPLSFFKVLGIVAPYGIALGLAGLGFGGISNFITLYYDYFHWQHAALCLSVFSIMFVLVRFIFSSAISRYGGVNVSLLCLVVETTGLLILYMASSPAVAMVGAAVTGFGFSLVFPALGVEAVRLAPPSNAGAALAGYGLFIDLSLGVTGPFAGTVVNVFGMSYLFAACAAMVFVGLVIVLYLKIKPSYLS